MQTIYILNAGDMKDAAAIADGATARAAYAAAYALDPFARLYRVRFGSRGALAWAEWLRREETFASGIDTMSLPIKVLRAAREAAAALRIGKAAV